ncbi:MAG: hypothetical protein ABI960_01610 [Candidatus Eisenbacteria bacterium]
MTGSAALLAATGLACLFAPDVVGRITGAGAVPDVLLQLIGGGLLGFASLNWISRYARLGGIYGRPVVVANFTHALIGALTLARSAFGPPHGAAFWIALVVYGTLALAFGILFFGSAAPADPLVP